MSHWKCRFYRCWTRYRLGSSSRSTTSWRRTIWRPAAAAASAEALCWTTSQRGRRRTRRAFYTTRCSLTDWPAGRRDSSPASRPTTRRPSTRRATDPRRRGTPDVASTTTFRLKASTSPVRTGHSLKQLEAASTHKSAKTHAGNVFVIRDLDLCPFDPKTNEFPWFIVEHSAVKFDYLMCIGFWDIVSKTRQTDRQTNRQTNSGENRSPATVVGVDNQSIIVVIVVAQGWRKGSQGCTMLCSGPPQHPQLEGRKIMWFMLSHSCSWSLNRQVFACAVICSEPLSDCDEIKRVSFS